MHVKLLKWRESRTAPRICLVSTIRNEAQLLRSNILYHHFLGVDHFYVYLDRTTDRGPDTIRDLPFVELHESFEADVEGHSADVSATGIPCDPSRHAWLRQRRNASDAIRRASDAGYDWLIHLDPDELVCVSPWLARRGQLKRFLGRVPAEKRLVVFRTWEVVQRFVESDDIFSEAVLFRRWVGDLRRKVLDPETGEIFDARSLYGHSEGKSAVRLGAEVKPVSVHDFAAGNGEPLDKMEAGYLLHYLCYSFDRFVTKYRNFADAPDHWPGGSNRPRHEIVWRNVVNTLGFDENRVREYYERWVLFSKADIKKWRARSRAFGFMPVGAPTLKYFYSVRRVFKRIDRGRRCRPGSPETPS